MENYFGLLRSKHQEGVTAILVAVMIMVLLSFGALAVDIGYVMVTKNELQNVADSAALAATRRLGSIYEPMSYTSQQTYDAAGNASTIKLVAKDIALKNQAGQKNIVINDDDVIIGTWDVQAKLLTPTLDHPDAVRVIARRDSAANGPITTFLARIFGTNTVDVSARATAALTSQSTVPPGNLVPLGISEQWFKQDFCDQPIKFHPTNSPEGCNGWNTYTHSPANTPYLNKILDGWEDGTFTPPGAKIGDLFVFIDGDVRDALKPFQDLFDHEKRRDDDGNDKTWTTTVVVYKSDSCSKPHGEMEIVGFATAVISAVTKDRIEATVICRNVEPGHGSGRGTGPVGSIPGLVE
jgi:Flp pilus assembly protein TadG